ncbi:hypothetical protein ACLOJK_003333 [Asimina triloba]
MRWPPLPPVNSPRLLLLPPPTSDDEHAAGDRLPLAADVAEEDILAVATAADTHHHRAIFAPIQAIHNDGDDEHIPDPSRPQADVDHRGHTRRIQEWIITAAAPNVFFSSPSHRLFSSKASVFISTPTSVINEAWIGRSRPFIIQATIPIDACCRPSPPEAAVITARDDADARTRVRPSPPAHHRLAMPARRHRLARPLPAARHSTCRQGRRGRVAPTANHGDADVSCRHSYSARTATMLDQNRL